ncbi:hypothetical protein DM860_007224 [Cuscuta australis]|uniref:Uncharacterized protein n=1 Tax=Cuscuta australis TaxID=267555 RepID=A0A328E355_9ASTE|nr:hypothetical protein DM860_007224 [Cuscuta australis]
MRLQRLGIETAMNTAAQGVSRRFSIKIRALLQIFATQDAPTAGESIFEAMLEIAAEFLDLVFASVLGRPLCIFCNKNSWLALLFWLGKPDFEPKLSGKFNFELGNLWDVLWADLVCGGLPFHGAAVLVRGGLLCAEMNLVLVSHSLDSGMMAGGIEWLLGLPYHCLYLFLGCECSVLIFGLFGC